MARMPPPINVRQPHEEDDSDVALLQADLTYPLPSQSTDQTFRRVPPSKLTFGYSHGGNPEGRLIVEERNDANRCRQYFRGPHNLWFCLNCSRMDRQQIKPKGKFNGEIFEAPLCHFCDAEPKEQAMEEQEWIKEKNKISTPGQQQEQHGSRKRQRTPFRAASVAGDSASTFASYKRGRRDTSVVRDSPTATSASYKRNLRPASTFVDYSDSANRGRRATSVMRDYPAKTPGSSERGRRAVSVMRECKTPASSQKNLRETSVLGDYSTSTPGTVVRGILKNVQSRESLQTNSRQDAAVSSESRPQISHSSANIVPAPSVRPPTTVENVSAVIRQPSSTAKTTFSTSTIYEMLENDHYADVIISTSSKQGKPIRAHKCILSKFSPLLDNLFKSSTAHPYKLKIDDFDAETVKAGINFCYGKISGIEGKEANVFKFAIKYDIGMLKETCTDKIEASITVANVCEIVQIASSNGMDDLYKKCLKFIVENKIEIPNLFTLPKEILLAALMNS